jgi:hypothetical protein
MCVYMYVCMYICIYIYEKVLVAMPGYIMCLELVVISSGKSTRLGLKTLIS